MSVQTQIDRIEQNVANTYDVLVELGADMPTEQNSDNLAGTAGTVKAVLYSKQTLTETQKAQARENIGVSVVNNFTTTEEGFVADARALKVLNDKIEGVTVTDIKPILSSIDGVSAVNYAHYIRVGMICIMCVSFKTRKKINEGFTDVGTIPEPMAETAGAIVSLNAVGGNIIIHPEGKFGLRVTQHTDGWLHGQCVYITKS